MLHEIRNWWAARSELTRENIGLGLFAVAIVLAVLLAQPASAQSTSDWKLGPLTTDAACGGTISSGRRCYYPFTGTGLTDSTVKVVTAEYATVCFDPDLAAAASGAGRVRIMAVADTSAEGAAGDPNTSEPVLNVILTGATTLACIYELPRGRYWVDVTVAAGAGINAVVTIEGSL